MRPGMDRDRTEAGTDPADLLRAELMAVEPSPAFADGVRARIQQKSAGSLMWLNAAAAVAVVAVTAFLSTTRQPANEAVRQVQATPTVASATLDVAAANASAALVAAALPRTARAAGESPRRSAPVFEVLVPSDQGLIVMSYLAAQARAEEDASAIAPVVVPPVEIPLIKIDPLPALTAANGGRNQ